MNQDEVKALLPVFNESGLRWGRLTVRWQAFQAQSDGLGGVVLDLLQGLALSVTAATGSRRVLLPRLYSMIKRREELPPAFARRNL